MTSDRAEHGSSSWALRDAEKFVWSTGAGHVDFGRGVYREKPASSQRGSGGKGQGFRPVVNQSICHHNDYLLQCLRRICLVSQSPDLCIVGAGALGIALALHARRLGASVVLARREGGEGPEVGSSAIKRAALAASAGLAEKLRGAAQMGLVPEARKASHKAVAARAEAIEASQAIGDHEAILRARGVEVVSGEVFFDGPRSLVVGDAIIKPGAILLACG